MPGKPVAAKKAPTKKGAKGQGVEGPPPSGIVQESTLPVWSDEEIETEVWGNMQLAVGPTTDPTAFHRETPEPPISPILEPFVKDWQRPHAIFSPFKPVVVRPNVVAHPYQDLEAPPVVGEKGQPLPPPEHDPSPQADAERLQRLAAYRLVKAAKDIAPVNPSGAQSPHARSRKRAKEGVGELMMAFNSAIMTVVKMQHYVGRGKYLWELIHPQVPMSGYRYPAYNPSGKYAVKLFWNGSFRKVRIDDRLPVDDRGMCLFTVTQAKEIWPALLVKAILQVLTPLNEEQLFRNAVWCTSVLLGGWVPQHLSPITETTTTLRYIRNAVRNKGHDPDLFSAASQTPASREAKPKQQRAPPPNASKDGKKGKEEKKVVDDGELTAVDEEPERLVVCATCVGWASQGSPDPPLPPEAYRSVGLETTPVYVLLDAVPRQCTTLLHLQASFPRRTSPDHEDDDVPFGVPAPPTTTGTGSWSMSSSWVVPPGSGVPQPSGAVSTPDNVPSAEDHWWDIWVTWEQFIEYFSDVYVFRNTTSRKYQFSHQVTMHDVLAYQAGLDPSEPLPADIDTQQLDPFYKYLYTKSPTATQILFVLVSLRNPPPLPEVVGGGAEEPPPHGSVSAGSGGSSHNLKPTGGSPSNKTSVIGKDKTAKAKKRPSEVPRDPPPPASTPQQAGKSASAPPPVSTDPVEGEGEPLSPMSAAGPTTDDSTEGASPITDMGPKAFSLRLSAYNWRQSSPVKYLTTFVAQHYTTNSCVLHVPKGEHCYRLEATNMPPDGVFAILSSREITMGDEMDICTNNLGLSIWIDGGEYAAHRPNESVIWFKRQLLLKQHATLTIDFSLLPVGTDISAIQNFPVDQRDAKKKGQPKGPPKPFYWQPPGLTRRPPPRAIFGPNLVCRPPPTDGEPVPEEVPTELLSHINLVLINCDTGATVEGVINRIPPTPLEANRYGYMLMAHGCTPTPYPPGLYKLQLVSDYPIDRIEARSSDSFLMKEGHYEPNNHYRLFKYCIASQELVFVTAQFDLVDDGIGVPYTLTICHNDNKIFEVVNAVGPTFIPHFWLIPPEKGQQSRYTIACQLDPTVAAIIHQRLWQQAATNFRLEREQQAAELLEEQKRLAEIAVAQKGEIARRVKDTDAVEPPYSASKKTTSPNQKKDTGKEVTIRSPKDKKEPGHDSARGSSQFLHIPSSGKQQKGGATRDAPATPNSSSGERVSPRAWHPDPKANDILYCLRLFCSSNRFTLEVDNAVAEEVIAAKNKWTKMEEGAPSTAAKGKDRQAAAMQELVKERGQKSKESRERFLSNMAGVFLPRPVGEEEVATGSRLPIVGEDDDPTYRVLAPKEPGVARDRRPQGLKTPDERAEQESKLQELLDQSKAEHEAHIKERESESQHLLHLMEYKDRQAAALRQFRQERIALDRDRRLRFWAERREEEPQRVGTADEAAVKGGAARAPDDGHRHTKSSTGRADGKQQPKGHGEDTRRQQAAGTKGKRR